MYQVKGPTTSTRKWSENFKTLFEKILDHAFKKFFVYSYFVIDGGMITDISGNMAWCSLQTNVKKIHCQQFKPSVLQ